MKYVACVSFYIPLLINLEAPHSDKIPALPSIDIIFTRTRDSIPSPDSFFAETYDGEYIRLKENTQRIRKIAAEPKKLDSAWDVYKKYREESYQLCRSLLQKSREYWQCDEQVSYDS